MVMDLQPPQRRPTRGTSCHRHPGQHPTGLCAPCLRERLSLLNPSASSTSASSSSSRLNLSLVPELRRCKTFSGNQCESIAPGFEPRRNSCDVRVRSSLWDLFNMEDEGRNDEESRACDVVSRNLGFATGKCPVLRVREADYGNTGIEIRHRLVRDDPGSKNNRGFVDEFEDSKRIKEFIGLEMTSGSGKPARRDFKEIAGSFWIAASVFSRRLRNLRPTSRERGGAAGGEDFGGMQIIDQRPSVRRQLRDSQSEAGEYGLGRRSCDTDPRWSVDDAGGRMWLDQLLGRRSCDATDSKFSVDTGRASVDGGRTSVSEVAARCSLEPPRASWDGGHVTSRTIPLGTAPAVSVIENAMATVYGFGNNNGTVIQDNLNMMVNGDGHGAHFDKAFLHRRRESEDFDRCCKMRHHHDEPRLAYKDKVSPASVELHRGARLLISEQEMRDLTGFSALEDDSLGSSELASKDVSSSSSGKSGKQSKKCRGWSKLWRIWGLLQPQNGRKCAGEVKLNNNRKGEDHRQSNASWMIPRLVRSYSSNTTPGPAHRMSSRTPTTGCRRKRREESFFDRRWFGNNRSDRYSPSSVDNGLLRFNLAPRKN